MKSKPVDFKKQEKELYRPSAKEPVIIEVPELPFVMVDGQGDPNTSEDFQAAMGALYGISYGIRMLPKKGEVPEGYFEYVVPPLEGIWDIKPGTVDPKNKDNFVWTVMIRQPLFVDEKLYEQAKNTAKAKKDNPFLDKTRFEIFREGLCCQIMHIGPFDTEPATFDLMGRWLEDQPYQRTEKTHHEIYLSDFRKTAPEKLKTVLRYRVQKT